MVKEIEDGMDIPKFIRILKAMSYGYTTWIQVVRKQLIKLLITKIMPDTYEYDAIILSTTFKEKTEDIIQFLNLISTQCRE